MQKNTLFVGAGDLACQAAQMLGVPCVGVRRSLAQVPTNMSLWQGDIQTPTLLDKIGAEHWHTVVITLTPSERSRTGYKQAYLEPMTALLKRWQAQPKQAPSHIIFASSTAVYAQANGQWVEETSPCEPKGFNGQVLLATEQVLMQSGLESSILRLGGIYGPGRDYLQRQVAEGQGGDESFTNRIHVADAAACIAWLVQEGVGCGILNVCDSDPAPSKEVRAWLAKQMGRTEALQPSSAGRGGNKRVSNQKLLGLGFQLKYPSYQDGYLAILRR